MIHAFGDSFVAGDQDDLLQDIDYLKYHVSFVSIVAKHLNLDLKNYADCGSDNWTQIDKLYINLENKNIGNNDLVLFGITSTTRDRTREVNCMSDNLNKILQAEQIYVLSILEKLSKIFNVRILKFCLFDNALYDGQYKFDDYLEHGTTIDMINETWGHRINHPSYHGRASIPTNFKNLYTKNLHPNLDGHKKIAQWFINNIDFTLKR